MQSPIPSQLEEAWTCASPKFLDASGKIQQGHLGRTWNDAQISFCLFFIAGAVRAQGMNGQLISSCWRTGECYKKGNTIKSRKQGFAWIARTSFSTTQNVPPWNKSNELHEWQCHSETKRWNQKRPFFFCRCRARSKLWRSSIYWFRLSIPTHENKVKRYLRCLPSNNQAATNTNKQQKQNQRAQPKNKQKTGHLVRRVKHYAFRKVPMPLSTAPRWNSNITHRYPTYPKVIIHCMWQWYKSYWATPGVGSSYQNCSTVIATTTTRCSIDLSPCSSM